MRKDGASAGAEAGGRYKGKSPVKGIWNRNGAWSRKDGWYLLALAAVTVAWLLFFFESTSPLYPYYHGLDSSFFMMTGRMVADGKVPYLDFFDMKGPIIFFIEGLGQWLMDGKMGIFIIQNLFFLAINGLCYAIARRFVKEGPAFLIVILNLLVLAATTTGGNFTEEFSLPAVLWCVWLAVVYVQRGKPEHPPLYAGIYGFAFMYLALIRVTNAAFICGIVGSVLVVLIGQKKWKNLFQNMGAFIAGAALCFLPVAAYFLSKGAFADMIYGTFTFPFLYSNDGIANRAASTWMSILYYIGPALIGMLAGLIYAGKKSPYMGYMMAFSSFLLIISLNMGRTSAHYFTMVTPAYVPGLAMIWQMLADRELRARPWPLFLTAALVMVAGTCYQNYHSRITTKISACLEYPEDESLREWEEFARSQGDMIPESDRDYVWGYNITPAWYFVNDIPPCNRYCAYQSTFVEMNPETEGEIYQMLDTVFPQWIVAPELDNIDLDYLRAVLETRYELVSDGDDMDLYHLKQ